MTSRIIDRDLGAKALLKRLKRIGVRGLTVGLHREDGAETAEGGATLAEVLSFHEFGTTDKEGTEVVPMRSVVRATVDEEKKQIKAVMKAVSRAIVSNRRRLRPENALGLVGEDIVTRMKRHITDGIPPPLKPATLKKRKGPGDTPLLDSRQIIQSLTFQIK